jgi:hypothetical protein
MLCSQLGLLYRFGGPTFYFIWGNWIIFIYTTFFEGLWPNHGSGSFKLGPNWILFTPRGVKWMGKKGVGFLKTQLLI